MNHVCVLFLPRRFCFHFHVFACQLVAVVKTESWTAHELRDEPYVIWDAGSVELWQRYVASLGVIDVNWPMLKMAFKLFPYAAAV